MNIDNDRASVRVVDVDDGKTLTTDEVRTLKRIAAMSKFVQWIVLFLASLMMFVGVDHLIEFLKRLSK
jgi:cell division protein FtsX